MSKPFDGRPVVPGSGRLRPLGIDEAEITGGFWGDRQEVNSSATIEHCHDWMERLGWVTSTANLRFDGVGGTSSLLKGRSTS